MATQPSAAMDSAPCAEPDDRPKHPSLARRLLPGTFSLLVGAVVWLPLMHLAFARDVGTFFSPTGVPDQAALLAQRHLAEWADPALRGREIEKMRRRNAEWDFMARTFLVAGLANMALRDPPSQPECLDVIDRIIAETVQLEATEGIHFFLLPYSHGGQWHVQPPRSLFVDGEIALMMALRRVVQEKEDYVEPLAERVAVMIEQMQRSPVLSAESYPFECWMFCNTVALAAIRLMDHLDGTDHSEFLRRWVATAKEKLVHPETGLLISSFTPEGHPLDGPEGSSIWMACHCLRIVDEEFARDQYRRARKELGRTLLGFGYAREWPVSWESPGDVDSGPVVPVIGASPGASGLAFLGASTFEDRQFLGSLLTSLEFAGFPSRKHGQLKYWASNQVGDAVLFYATMQGPIWREVLEGRPR